MPVTNQPDEKSMKLLQWVQQQAGISRRKAQELVAAGEVTVNGRVVTDPFASFLADEIDHFSLRGHPLTARPPEPRAYRYHKPPGMLCSHDDRFSGDTVGRILRAEGFIGYTWIGRLDQDAEGLLVLTNHGDLVHAFTHPSYEVEKVYHVWLSSTPAKPAVTRLFAQMKRGVTDEGETLRIVDGRHEGRSDGIQITLTEGKKHEIKRLFAHFDLKVTRILRVAIGPVSLGTLPRGVIERIPLDAEAQLFATATHARKR